MKRFRSVFGWFALLVVVRAEAATLPGFRVEKVGTVQGFVSSIATDSKGTIYVTTTDGWIHRVNESGQSTKVMFLPTKAGGNSGLLGMAMLDDRSAVVHYTTWSGEKVLDDVIARVDLVNGTYFPLATFVCDVEWRPRGVSSEHHGGNPTVADDGRVYVGIGEYAGFTLAQKPEWNGGKIWRIDPHTGESTQWALGLRNPYDVAWDPEIKKLIVPDNGPSAGDEIHVVAQGQNCGWPNTFGHEPPLEGATAPVFVFDHTIAPTGITRLDGANPILQKGYLLGSFVSRSLFYFPTLTDTPVHDPIPLVDQFSEFVIDVTQAKDGSILFATATGGETSSVQRLIVPPRGDCNGDGLTDWQDVYPLMLEIRDGAHTVLDAQQGTFAGSWGCDANGDNVINNADLETLYHLVNGRLRAVRAP